ncbi:MAG: putative molybdenum carrier protein [Verrucomicrobiota bacterium]
MNATAIPAPNPTFIEIISGGQTGADRAGLDVAIARGLPHCGWCPKGRKAEDGPLPACYCLTETPSASYLVRTERNAAESDATVIFTIGSLTGGSKRTAEFAKRHRRPFLHLSLVPGRETLTAEKLADFIRMHRVARLNVAGSRESKAPGIHALVCRVLDITLCLLLWSLHSSSTALLFADRAPRFFEKPNVLSSTQIHPLGP